MYTAFYGLREKPFALSPDPRFLFLAESHREALAHLLYGVEQGEGFIVITGEVGTGKTTLCRTLLQRLGAETEVAFLFNPKLSPLELLEAVHAEFGLSGSAAAEPAPADTAEDAGRPRIAALQAFRAQVRARWRPEPPPAPPQPAPRTARELNDSLNRFLLEKHREGRRVLLIVDEAQNLENETLEQIRLLSNLETETSKLIQILLLGQPELDEKLDSPQLRQLKQRISVHWKLTPLGSSETREYVRHRLRIAAGAERDLFSTSALREVHRRSAGIPRVVNILCDRALLAGYAAGEREIGSGQVLQAYREMQGGRARSAGPRWRMRGAALAALFLASLFAGLAWQRWLRAGPGAQGAGTAPAVSSAPAAEAAAAGAEPADASAAGAVPQSPLGPPLPDGAAGAAGAIPEAFASAPAELAAISPAQAAAQAAELQRAAQPLATLLLVQTPVAAGAHAAQALLRAWGVEAPAPPPGEIPELLDSFGARGLSVLALREIDLDFLRLLDHPALLRLSADDGTTRLVALLALDAEAATLIGLGSDGTQTLRLPAAELEARWAGEAYVVWRDFEALPPVLRPGETGRSVTWLQRTLAELGYYRSAPSGRYDEKTVGAVLEFQRRHGLEPDGSVGPRTKMTLYEALGRYAVPRLSGEAHVG